MEGMEGVVEEFDPIESGTEAQEVTTEQAEPTAQAEESPFAAKTAREFSQWLKGLKDANPNDPNVAKYARMAKDAYSRGYALNQLEQKGIDGVRERYALMDSVIHNDPERGELKGADAIAALQDSARQIAEIDEKIAAGDVTALDNFSDGMKAGIVKMAPAILDMAQKMDPAGYSDAILPHFVQALSTSPLVQNYNAMVDVMNEQMPSWLPEDKKQAWSDDRMRRIMGMAGNMGSWLNAQADKAGKGVQGPAHGAQETSLSQREQEFNKREQDAHWTSKISPTLDKHAATKFEELFRPYDKRLKLDAPTRQTLRSEFSKRVSGEAAKDKAYMAQIGRYRSQKNPDPSTVANYAKVQFDKHAKTVMDALVNERYKPFLTGKPTQQTKPGTVQQPAAASGVQLVSVKPAANTIDHKNTPIDWMYAGKYRLTSGKVVQVKA